MAEIGNDSAGFVGVDVDSARPRSSITGATLETMASDLAAVYQQIKGVTLDGGALATINPQIHDGTDGHLLALTLGSLNTGHEVTCDLYNFAAGDKKIAARWPVFIPAGCSQIVIDYDFLFFPTSSIYISISDATLVEQDGGYADSDNTPIVLDIASPGAVHVVTVYVTRVADSLPATDRDVRLRYAAVHPYPWRKAALLPVLTDDAGASAPPVISATWQRVYDYLTQDNRPVSSKLTGMLASNLNHPLELTTGVAAVGASSSTVNGHTHNGTDSHKIDLALAAAGLGSALLLTSSANGLTSTQGTIFGPNMDDDLVVQVYHRVHSLPVYVPDVGGTATLHFAFIYFDDGGVGVSSRLYAGSVPFASSVYASSVTTTTTSGWHVVTGTITSLPDDRLWYLEPQWKSDALKGGEITLCGVAYWLEG